MREIKFRVWKNGEMSDSVDFGDLGKNEIISDTKGSKLLQFTGLLDKNGKEIYEGDIVIEKYYPFFGNAPEIKSSNQQCDELNYVGVVVWDEGYYLDLQAVSSRVRGSAAGQNLYDYENLEVIGNLYENPELLKEVK